MIAAPAPRAAAAAPARASAASERRLLRSVARAILPKNQALQGCGARIVDPSRGVSVLREPNGRAVTANVRSCGRVWLCPVCAAAITEARAIELEHAADTWIYGGSSAEDRKPVNSIALMTLTVRHSKRDRLADLVDADGSVRIRGLMSQLRDALTDLQGARSYKAAKADLRLIGQVRALEVTWGEENGWHPHFHVLLFIRGLASQAALEAFRSDAFDLWSRACVDAGLGAPARERGVHVVLGETSPERIAAYCAKYAGAKPQSTPWAIEREMAKGHSKRAHDSADASTRYTPFDLLRAAHATGLRDQRFTVSFMEYAEAFQGARQLVWSRGLRAQLAVLGMSFPERDDAEIADIQNVPSDAAKLVMIIDRASWTAITRAGLDRHVRDVVEESDDLDDARLRLLLLVGRAFEALGLDPLEDDEPPF